MYAKLIPILVLSNHKLFEHQVISHDSIDTRNLNHEKFMLDVTFNNICFDKRPNVPITNGSKCYERKC
jgi:hypothetical protein